MEEDDRVYLRALYDAETGIARVLSNMLDRPLPFTFFVNFDSEPLSVLASDPDQVHI